MYVYVRTPLITYLILDLFVSYMDSIKLHIGKFYFTILQDRVEGTRKIGRPKWNLMDVYEWNGMSTRSLLDVTKYHYIWKKLCITPYHVPRLFIGLVK